MSWKMSRISSLMGRMGESDSDSAAQSNSQLEDIRSSMLASMAEYLIDPAAERPVWAKVLYAKDVQTLWYLRSDVMHLLSDHCGEGPASAQVSAITQLFRGQLPNAQFASSQRRG